MAGRKKSRSLAQARTNRAMASLDSAPLAYARGERDRRDDLERECYFEACVVGESSKATP